MMPRLAPTIESATTPAVMLAIRCQLLMFPQ
jgi:hypothetical protein